MDPSRFRNYVPIKSTWEVQAAEEGPTSPPPRDCTRHPGKSMCNCREIIAATAAEAYACEVKVQALEVDMPDIATENYITKFDHPLFNTLLRMNSTVWRGGLKRAGIPDFVAPDEDYAQPRKECRACMLKIAAEMPHAKQPNEPISGQITPFNPEYEPTNVDDGEVNFLQLKHRAAQPYSLASPPKYEPEEFGWRIFDESPDWSAVLRGMCTKDEIQSMEEGLAYFWSCDANRQRLDAWVRKTKAETVWVDSHPATRLGIYSEGGL
jgi:hypothetical protein